MDCQLSRGWSRNYCNTNLLQQVAVLQYVSSSLESFLCADKGHIFKVLLDGDDARVSCDPLEVLEAHGLDSNIAVEVMHDVMEGLAVDGFGRRPQVQVAVLLAELMPHLVVLRNCGTSVWVIRTTLQEIAVSLEEFPLLHGAGDRYPTRTDSDEDDVEWFFESTVDPQASRHTPAAVAQLDGVPEVQGHTHRLMLREISERLQGVSRHCFVYAGPKLEVQPEVSLWPGIIAQVHESELNLGHYALQPTEHQDESVCPELISRALFLDTDLISHRYENCTPSWRRMQQTLSSLAPTSSAALPALLAEDIQNFVARNGVGAIFLSGTVAQQVWETSRTTGVLILASLPSRLLQALAAEAQAPVLLGLPSVDDEADALLSKLPLRLSTRSLSPEARKDFFSFPLRGHKVPMLPHQNAIGDALAAPCWEVRLSSVEHASGQAMQTKKVLTAEIRGCHAAHLRSLHAMLGDMMSTSAMDTNTNMAKADLDPWQLALEAVLAVIQNVARGQVNQPKWLFSGSASEAVAAHKAIVEAVAAALRAFMEKDTGRGSDLCSEGSLDDAEVVKVVLCRALNAAANLCSDTL